MDAVLRDNKKKEGVRKWGGQLVNHGRKLTKEEIAVQIAENKRMYGLSEEYIRMIKLPHPSNIRIYDLDKIVGGRLFTIPEKIDHILALK